MNPQWPLTRVDPNGAVSDRAPRSGRWRIHLAGFAAMFLGLAAAQAQVGNPIFTPPSGTPTPVVVTITNANPGVVTYFTLDGTLPDTDSTRYTGPLTLTDYTVIRARAYGEGLTHSAAVSAHYYPIPATPTLAYFRSVENDLPDTPLVTVRIELTNSVEALSFIIEERVSAPLQVVSVSDGGVWNPASGTVRWGPFAHAPGETLVTKTVSYRVSGIAGSFPVDGFASVNGQWTLNPAPGWVTIESQAVTVSVPEAPSQSAMPAFASTHGVAVPTEVTLSCPTPDAVIRYTVDGSWPTESSPIYGGPIQIENPALVRARSFRAGWIPSATGAAYYGEVAAPPRLAVTRTVDTNGLAGPVVTFEFNPSPDARCFVVEETLPAGLSAFGISSEGVFIAERGLVRWGPFLGAEPRTLSYTAVGLPGTYPVRARWSVDGVGGGEVETNHLVLPPPAFAVDLPAPPSQVPQPVLSPAGSGTLPQTVTISSADAEAELRFTLDGTLPTLTSPLYTTPLEIAGPAVLRARAFRPGSAPSPGAVAYYGLAESWPGLQLARGMSPDTGVARVVTLTVTPRAGADPAFCFTVEERLPVGLIASAVTADGVFSAGEGVVRWGPFFGPDQVALSYQAVGLPGPYPVRATWSINGVSQGDSAGDVLVINAPASNPGTLPGAPIQLATPVLSPARSAGLPATVSITTPDPGTEIRYTLDGSSPTRGSVLYVGPLTINMATTVRARSFRDGYPASAGAVGYYSVGPSDTLVLVRSLVADASYLPTVMITATPGSIRCYAVTESLALGLTPYHIGQDGIWDADRREIRWGPYADAQPRVLSYAVTGDAGAYPLAGAGSFDGRPVTITGASVVRVDQTTVAFAGNGDIGFGGAIGHGRLILSNDGTTLYGTLVTSGPLDQGLVVYLAPDTEGFASTAGFTDASEPLRAAISGFTEAGIEGGPARSALSFLPDFAPRFALALQPGHGVNFGGLWALENGGPGSLRFIADVHLAPAEVATAGIYRFSLNTTNLGLVPGAQQSFKLLGTFVSTNGFRSTEAIAGNLTGVQGWNLFAQTGYATYTMIPAILPAVFSPPGPRAVIMGETVRFEIEAIGTQPLSYQWLFNGQPLVDSDRINGIRSKALTVVDAQLSDTGTYAVEVSNAHGRVVSEGAGLLVTVKPPPRLESPQAPGGGEFAFTLKSDPGLVFDILVSSDLVTWSTLTTVTNGTGQDSVILPVSGNATFYWARSR